MIKALVFDIKRYAIHDGPGIRTSIFFKGCPIRCWWCHNPEGQEPYPEMMYYENRCIICGTCEKVCPLKAVSIVDGKVVTNRKLCDNCGVCVEYCPTGAREFAGKWYTIQELLEEAEADRPFYEESGGGVTISGGEPLMQHEFVIRFLEELKRVEIHTAVDTSGYVSKEIMKNVSRFTDLFLYDLKVMDPQKHLLYTGVRNDIILNNLKLLDELGARIWVRFPLIPGVNDDEANVRAMSEFVSNLKSVEQLNILPYHPLGVSKAERLGKEQKRFEKPNRQLIDKIMNILEEYGLLVKVGG